MKRCTLLVALFVLGTFTLSASAADMYWDDNGTDPGFFTPGSYADGTWSNTDLQWNPSAAGTDPVVGWNDGGGDTAIFDVMGASPANDFNPNTAPVESDAIIALTSRSAGGVVVKSGGWVEFTGTGPVAVGGGTARVESGAIMSVGAVNQFTFTAGGGYLLDGGTLDGRWSGIVTQSENITVTDSGGTVIIPTGSITIMLNATAGEGSILGLGGTTTNGGAGKFIKSGPGEYRLNGVSHASNTYAKLEVRDGLVRHGNSAPNHETAWGAIPLTETADQITLNGTNASPGYIGSSTQHSSLHPNRGITIADNAFGGNNGGTLNTLPGPLTGSSSSTLVITGGGGFAFNNANNVNTFFGAFEMRGTGLVFVNEDLNAKNLFGAGTGTVQVAIGKNFTVGSDGSSTSYAGNVSGSAGSFTKVGAGTITMSNGILTGNVNVNAGTLQFAGSADFGDRTSAVNIASGATVDMAGIVDIIGGLNGAGAVINHNATTPGAGGNTAALTDQMTLRGAKVYNFSGTIDGAGAVIKDGVGTQTFSGANTYSGGTTVSNGKMLINNTSGSGTGTGNVTVSGSGILAGTGSIQGSVTLSGTGQLNAGQGSGAAADLVVGGSVTQGAGTSIGLTLGDELDVTATNNGLTLDAGGVLTILGKEEGVTAGTHTVVDYTGAIQGASVASMPVNNASGYDLTGLGVHDHVGSTSIRVEISGTVQDRDWSGGDGNWSYAPADAGNWSGGSGGQANGPGAIAEFNGAGGTVTVTDSNKAVGNLNLNSASSYTIAASGSNRLVTDAYGANTAQINLASGSTHTISAPLTTNKRVDIDTNGGTLNIAGGLANKAGIKHTGTGTLAIASANNTAQVMTNNSLIENAAGNMTITTTGTGILWNNGDGTILNSGSGTLNIALNDATNIGLVNNGLIQNSGAGSITITGASATQSTASSNAVNDFLTNGVSKAGTFLNTGAGSMTISSSLSPSAGLIFGGNITVSGVIGAGGGAGSFGNSLGKGSSITIDGPGTVTFAQTVTNTYTGRTTLKSGTLQISADNQLGGVSLVTGGAPDQIIFDGGTLRLAVNMTINANRGISITANGGTIEAGGASPSTYAGRLHGSGDLTKTGIRSLNLNGQSVSYHGTLNVNAGSLRFNGITGGGAAVNSSGTLQGTGTLRGSVTVNSGGTISASTNGAIGTLTMDSLDLNAGSLLTFDLGAPTAADLLNVTGTNGLTIDGGAVNFLDAGGLAAGTYTLIDYVGSLAGSGVAAFLSQTPTGPAGFTYALQDTGSTIDVLVTAAAGGDINGDGLVNILDYVVGRIGNEDLTDWSANYDGALSGSGSGNSNGGTGAAVPEPSSVLLVVLGLAAATMRRRGR